MTRLSGSSFVIGRREGEGDLKDVRIYTTPEGFNRIDIARDTKDITGKSYVVERRLKDGSWSRLLYVESFNRDATIANLSESRVSVQYDTLVNDWNIKFNRTWGLPYGMETPWYEPIEMIGNELLMPPEAAWVIGDAPVNRYKDNAFTNGKYRIEVGEGVVSWYENTGEFLGSIRTDTANLYSSEGVAGAVGFDGGNIYVEPAKPATFTGSFTLEEIPEYVAPGLYRYQNAFLFSTSALPEFGGEGTIALFSDPYPERWVERLVGRAYVTIESPSNEVPFFEEEPERVGVGLVYPDNDFPDIEPEVVTPYANETGVFNSWDVDSEKAYILSAERPYDVFVSFDYRMEDKGGLPLYTNEERRPAEDRFEEPNAAYPNDQGYLIEDLPEIPIGSLYLEWKDSQFFYLIDNAEHMIAYRRGYVYFLPRKNRDNSGIIRLDSISQDWNRLKIEWTENSLRINNKAALQKKNKWLEVMYDDDGNQLTWAELGNITPSSWRPDPEQPIDEEQYEEREPDWETGQEEDPANMPDLEYDDKPRTWGRILFEKWHTYDSSAQISAGSELGIGDIGDQPIPEE